MHSPWSRERELEVYFEDLNIELTKQDGRLSEQASVFSSPFPAYDSVVDCGLLLNREMIDILQRNLNASFGLLRRLAGARCISEIIALQAAHFNNQVAALIAQTQELADLSIKATSSIFRSSITERW